MDNILGLSFVALSALFTVWNGIYLVRYVTYRRIASRAELTWLPKRPWFFNLCLGIGFFLMVMTFITIFVLRRPPLSIIAQGLMAIFYTVLFPLSFRIRRGLYASGIWTEQGFVAFDKIRSLSWLERPEIVLMVKTEPPFGYGYARLRVPGEFYGQARRILARHIDDNTLSVEKSILGLRDSEASAQEQI
ncbi:MAG TPA: hypothetical protein VEK15_27150 [Vicinamibacteria bacterium]|nr:hypothetical protein [Vicinamibacteria bacterium]